MREREPDVRLLVKVAKLYYFGGLTQDEISARYHTSRSTISRMLKQARDSGILTITIREPEDASHTQLEERLEHDFGLKEAVVVEPGETPEVTTGHLGQAAAAYLTRVIRPGDIIGVSWGHTLRAAVEAVPSQPRGPLQVVPLIGGSGRSDPDIHANQLANRLARALGGEWYPLHAPAMAGTPEVRAALDEDAGIRAVLEMGARARVALVGISHLAPGSTMYRTGYLGPEEYEYLARTGAVGDCNSRFFDASGRAAADWVNRRVVGLSLEELGRIPLTIGVAGGIVKRDAIRAALRGGFLDVLVTDAEVAANLLG